jgi:hypothetical protein
VVVWGNLKEMFQNKMLMTKVKCVKFKEIDPENIPYPLPLILSLPLNNEVWEVCVFNAAYHCDFTLLIAFLDIFT